MAKVDCKATILELHIVKLYRCNQQRQKLPRSNWEKLVLSIIFASSGVAWFAAANGIAMAANPGICESKSMVSAILSPVEPPNKTRSPITSEIAQVVSQGEDFELLKTVPHNAWVAALGQGREQGGQGGRGAGGDGGELQTMQISAATFGGNSG